MTFGLVQRWRQGAVRLWARPDWVAALGPEHAREIMDVQLTDRTHAKQGRSTGRLILRNPKAEVRVYLKRHRELPWWQRWLALLWPSGGWSPGWTEFRQLRWAQAVGLAVPAPAAVGEFIGPGLQLQSYLAIDELIDMLPLNEAVAVAESELDQATFQNWKRRAALELARLTRILHGYGRYHKDLYLCHFFVQRPTPNDQGPRRGEMFMIDLHRMRQHRLTGWYWRIKDLAQLLYSSDLPQVTVWDRVRFFRAYLGRRVDRRLLSAVVLKAGRYRRHNHKQSARPMNARQRVGVR